MKGKKERWRKEKEGKKEWRNRRNGQLRGNQKNKGGT
jgi:hypothetical protein